MPSLVFVGCGSAGYNESASLGVSSWVISRPARSGVWWGVKTLTFTRSGSQAGSVLYTVLAQHYAILISVARVFIHTIHRAYKEISNSKKGIL